MSSGRRKLRRISAHEFVRRLKERAGEPDCHYTFWLGAGCSVTSGIPAASSLVREDWLPRLHRVRGGHEVAIDEWARREFRGYDPDDPAALYGPLMKELFPLSDERQRETERLCDGRAPAFGYAVLAALMSLPNGVFSAALTTNFDDLVADAMYVFGDRRPLVIQHEALAGFVRPGRVQRPLVVKVHGDHRLNPMHTEVETAELERGIREGIRGLLQDRGVIFNGYSGNDRGVIDALDGLPTRAIPLGVWWVSRAEPRSAIRGWLLDRDATWVEAAGFDELMLLFREEFQIEHPTAQKFERMIDSYRETYGRLSSRVEELPDTAPDSDALKKAAKRARESATEWWKVQLEADKVKNEDPDRADRIYREGVEKVEDSRLLTSYGIFLVEEREEFDRAEQMFERAIAADPENIFALGSLALFLKQKRKNYDRAEELYELATAGEAPNPTNLCNYAIFLHRVRKEFDRAEELYERAIALGAKSPESLSAYAIFLSRVRGESKRAEELFERALAVNPERANTWSDYALFVEEKMDDFDRAEELHQRALALDPDDADVLGNFGRHLLAGAKDKRAWEVIEKAFDLAREEPLLAELWFYTLALGPESKAQQALEELAVIVSAGGRSMEWNFSGILDRAAKQDHPDIEWLRILADVIADRTPVEALKGWDKWQRALGAV